MTVPSLRLEHAAIDPLDFSLAEGWVVEVFDLGTPEIREVMQDAPDTDGEIDSTLHIGARDFIITGTMLDDRRPLWEMRQHLRRFLSPQLRSTLYVSQPGDVDKQAIVRARQMPDRIVDRGFDSFRAVFRCSRGVLESAQQSTATVYASGSGSAGITFDVEFPFEFPAATPEGSTQVVNAGTADAFPLLRLYGPWSGQTSIINDLTGRRLVFVGESIAAGDFLEIDTRAKTIRLNGDPNNSRYQRLVFPDSAWFTLVPGAQRIRFVPSEFSTPAQAEIVWRSAWL